MQAALDIYLIDIQVLDTELALCLVRFLPDAARRPLLAVKDQRHGNLAMTNDSLMIFRSAIGKSILILWNHSIISPLKEKVKTTTPDNTTTTKEDKARGVS